MNINDNCNSLIPKLRCHKKESRLQDTQWCSNWNRVEIFQTDLGDLQKNIKQWINMEILITLQPRYNAGFGVHNWMSAITE